MSQWIMPRVIRRINIDCNAYFMEVTRAYKFRIYLDARDTTQECSSCHYIKKGEERLTLEDRTYHCNVCGMAMDRDVNASINILHRATTLGQRGSHAQGEIVRPQREALLEELRTYPANNRGSLGL